MLIAVLPAVFAVTLSFAALGLSARRTPSLRSVFAGVAAAGVALSLGILIDNLLRDRGTRQPSTQACGLLSVSAIGAAAVALFAIRTIGGVARELMENRATVSASYPQAA